MIRDYGEWESHFHDMRTAKKAAKNRYHGRCLATLNYDVDMCHIYPRSVYPALRACDLNMVPLVWYKHTGKDDTLDWVEFNKLGRSVPERFAWLLNNTKKGFQEELKWQLENLVAVAVRLNLSSAPLSFAG